MRQIRNNVGHLLALCDLIAVVESHHRAALAVFGGEGRLGTAVGNAVSSQARVVHRVRTTRHSEGGEREHIQGAARKILQIRDLCRGGVSVARLYSAFCRSVGQLLTVRLAERKAVCFFAAEGRIAVAVLFYRLVRQCDLAGQHYLADLTGKAEGLRVSEHITRI